MTAAHDDLALDFPEHLARIEHLRASNAEFSRLFEEYREACMELHAIGAKAETPTAAYVVALRKRRLHLKDEIHRFLSAL
ncbi:MAG TPA: DUF465 domain-containing protein [Labilithrix sp.]|nr:DUF465 domain-containing protein [Labilithrix sp.]